jgi:alpha-L-rhamnosidase
MIKDGGTTVTEYWDSHTGTRNLINLAGPLGVWFYETVAGIRLDPSHPGYEHINLKPQPIGDLTYAEAQTETIRGEVKGSWKLAEGKLFVSVTIPANTTATLALPVAANAAVQEAEGDGTGVTPSTGAHSYASWTRELGSGTYHFNVPFHR